MMTSVTENRCIGTVPVVGALGRALMLVLVWSCVYGCGDGKMTAEDAVRAWVDRGHHAAEEKDRSALVGMISPSYSDARGNGRKDIEDLFRLYFLRQQKVALLTRIVDLETYDDTAAKLVMDVGMAGTDDSVLGFSADAYTFEMELEKDGDDWLLIAARWGQIGRELR